MNPYGSDMIKQISNDPMYIDFAEFKEQQVKQNEKLKKVFEQEDENDIF